MIPFYLAVPLLLAFNPHVAADPLADTQLLDILLLASVDGNFHALNRSTGHTLWSTAPSTRDDDSSPLGPLVRTSHDPAAGGTFQETLLVEPQSGAIFTMPSPTDPLQRLPFSMPELASMSPVTYHGRVFVARKETSVLLLDLETGIVAVAPAQHSRVRFQGAPDDVHLDATEVAITREEYHVAVHTPRSPVLDLYFARYGPHEEDDVLQAAYQQTKDGLYAQSRPYSILAVNTRVEGASWMYLFNESMFVAAFDILRTPTNTFALLQPRPQLSAILPNLAKKDTPFPESVYVGLVDKTRTLFAMSSARFPLLAFIRGRPTNKVRVMAAPLPGDSLPLQKQCDEDERCLEPTALYTDLWCLTGMRRMGDGESPTDELRMSYN
ncbi:hypothetical protein B0H17DRAFT_1039299 [Mycena rosella]|uniref:ER membrane protein complex subunit 1 n=1 Tax=Mycena rosella TaxID=1033263 RepID=A0AAD7M786_MYCRO|nr:hypothetical protein B0H17DRAFT_1039299 [Mycena rosella]